MSMIKKIITATFILSLALPALALAAYPSPVSDHISKLSLIELVTILTSFTWPIIIGLSGVAFTVSAILFITVNDDPVRLVEARKALLLGLIGTVAAIATFCIPLLVQAAVAATATPMS